MIFVLITLKIGKNPKFSNVSICPSDKQHGVRGSRI